MEFWWIVAPALAAGCSRVPSKPLKARSPDGQIEIVAGTLVNGSLAVRIRHHGSDVIAPSPVGLVLADQSFGPMRIEHSRRAADQAAELYRELLVQAREIGGSRRPLLLHLRAYDTGPAFRIEQPRTANAPEIRLVGEATSLRLPRDYQASPSATPNI